MKPVYGALLATLLAGTANADDTWMTPLSMVSSNAHASCGDCNVCGETTVSCGESCGSGLKSLFQHSDPCFDDFVSPMTNPVFFEDPRTLTEARFIFMNHTVPNNLGGGEIQLYALQLRAALTERLSLIATKDGYAVSSSPLVDDGWADLAGGLKYNVYRDTCNQRLLSVGFTYEAPFGSPRTLQGNGDGEFNLFMTGATKLGQDWHLIGATGLRLPVDDDAENQVWYASAHVDRRLGNSPFYLVGEFNLYHWMSSSSAFGVPVEGIDLFNLGSVGVDNNDIVTGAVGLKIKPSRNTEIGVIIETHLTNRRDVFEDRLGVDWILRY